MRFIRQRIRRTGFSVKSKMRSSSAIADHSCSQNCSAFLWNGRRQMSGPLNPALPCYAIPPPHAADPVSELESKVVDAWHQAAADLGVQFTAPFITTVDGNRLQFLGLVHSFGRPMGTVISVTGQPSAGKWHPHTDNYFRSMLSGDSYQVYDRK